MGLCVFLSGSRPKRMLERIDEAIDSADIFPFSFGQADGPEALFMKSGSLDAVDRVAEIIGAEVVVDPAARLVELVENLTDLVSTVGSPPRDEPDLLSRFDSSSLTWRSTHITGEPSLYRMEWHGRYLFRLFDGDEWYSVDLPTGQMAEFKRIGKSVLKWTQHGLRGQSPSLLTVPKNVLLPELAHRAAVSCSGLLPLLEKSNKVYRNVPLPFAQKLAAQLHQTLQTE